MSLPTEDIQVKAAADAAEHFINLYYDSRNKRLKLAAFYTTSFKDYKDTPADISINGAVLAQPTDYDTLLEQQGQGVHYEVESFDAQPLNPNYNIGCPEALLAADKTGAKVSVVVSVVGRVQYGRGKDAKEQNFTESFVLVPNWEAFGRPAPGRDSSIKVNGSLTEGPPGKRRLIVSQNFRAL